jgi:HK97 family phage major capsid protein
MRILLDPAPAAGGGGTIVVDEKKIRSETEATTRTKYLTRAREITVIADAFIKDHGAKDGGKMDAKIRSIANEFLSGEQCDAPIENFKTCCLTDILAAKSARPIGLEEVTDDPSQYSIQRGIQSAMRRAETGKTNPQAAIPDGREGEVHAEIIRRASQEPGGLGYEPAGFLVPHDATLGGTKLTRADRSRLTRDSQATIFPAGGAFVPTELRIPVIEILRNMMVLDRAGFCQTLAGLTGNILIPRQEATATAYSVGEIDQLTASQQILGQIALSPKRVGSKQIYSKQFVMQSTPDAEGFIRNDHFEVIARQWDRLGLVGQGAGDEPMGIFNTPGCQSIIFGGTATWGKMVDMETALRTMNVTDELVYVSTPAVKGALKKIAVALTGATVIGGTQNAIWIGRGQDGEVNGSTALDSNQIPGNVVMLGAKNQAIKAIWGGLDIVSDIFTRADRAEVVLTINTWGDFAVRHPQAFIVSADAGNQ